MLVVDEIYRFVEAQKALQETAESKQLTYRF